MESPAARREIKRLLSTVAACCTLSCMGDGEAGGDGYFELEHWDGDVQRDSVGVQMQVEASSSSLRLVRQFDSAGRLGLASRLQNLKEGGTVFDLLSARVEGVKCTKVFFVGIGDAKTSPMPFSICAASIFTEGRAAVARPKQSCLFTVAVKCTAITVTSPG